MGSRGDIVINEFMAANDSTVVPGAAPQSFDDWIELRNTGASTVDLSGWTLDDGDVVDGTAFPSGTSIGGGGYLLVLANGEEGPNPGGLLQVGFKLSKGGEVVTLRTASGSVVSQFSADGSDYPAQDDDVSYGLHPTSGQAVFFDVPTPGSANDPAGVARVPELSVSPSRGFYNSEKMVTVFTTEGGATIYYTLDGSSPLEADGSVASGALTYSAPIEIEQTSVLRAVARKSGFADSTVTSHTYFLMETENAGPTGSDPNGLNPDFLEQTQPAGYGDLASGDYDMDARISRSFANESGQNGDSRAQTLLKGMRDIPTVSIAMAADDFVDIYANPLSEGPEFEKACSFELLPARVPERDEFQINCGLRVQGGASRMPGRSPKHSLSFRFRSQYGESKLREPIFPESEVDSFNSIALRAVYNNSWIHFDGNQRLRASLIRDQWMRESMRDMGSEDAGAGFFAHVFVNGLYFGIHNVAERQDNTHYAEYNGGDEDLIDARNGSKFVEGDDVAFNAMVQVVESGDWQAIQQVLDVDTYIDYQILQRYGANQDLKASGNWRGAGGGPFTTPTEMRPWKIFSWDGERVLEDVGSTFVPIDPFGIRDEISQLPQFRQRFAERARLHFSDGGALTPAAARARWEKYANQLDRAILAEAARWGDDRRPADPYDRNDWLAEQARLYGQYFPARSANVQGQLNSAGLFLDIDPPKFIVGGAEVDTAGVAAGDTVSITADDGTIYYTLDGTDPLGPDGQATAQALVLGENNVFEPLVDFEETGWLYQDRNIAESASNVVKGAAGYNSNDWKHPDFSASRFESGRALFAGTGFDSINAATARTVIDIGPSGNRYPTVYFRKDFTVTNAATVKRLRLRIIRDDGVIVYLNGKEIVRDNLPSGVVTNGTYTGVVGDENIIHSFDYIVQSGDLAEGRNVLAIELHNIHQNSSDLGMDAEVSISRSSGDSSLTLNESTEVNMRVARNGLFSGLSRGVFVVGDAATTGSLALTEVMYHPREATWEERLASPSLALRDRDRFEFIEVINTGSTSIDLGGLKLEGAVEHLSAPLLLAAGERAVYVKDAAAFASRYGSGVTIAGGYDGKLANSGENLRVVALGGDVIADVTYNEGAGWPSRADGRGSSLERIAATNDAAKATSWRASVGYDGSPRTADFELSRGAVINEVSSNDDQADFIELHNVKNSPTDITGWFLSDDAGILASYIFGTNTLGANGYSVITEADYDFANVDGQITNYVAEGDDQTLVTSAAHGLVTGNIVTISGYGGFGRYADTFEVRRVSADVFAIEVEFIDNVAVKGTWQRGRPFGLNSRRGETLYLVATDSFGEPVAFADEARFLGAPDDISLGRWSNGGEIAELVQMTSQTSGSANAGPILGDLFVSEIYPLRDNLLGEPFIEIASRGSVSQSLRDWRVRGSVDYDFADSAVLPAGGAVVIVGFDPVVDSARASAFRQALGMDAAAVLLGPWENDAILPSAGIVRLDGPLNGEDSRVTVDTVFYEGSAPWPTISAAGESFTRRFELRFGRFASSWHRALATPGEARDLIGEWLLANGLGPDAGDADGDQLPNLVEYALGTDPNSAQSWPSVIFSGSAINISYPHRIDRPEVTLTLQRSVDLQIWDAVMTTSQNLPPDVLEMRSNEEPIGDDAAFWRLEARR